MNSHEFRDTLERTLSGDRTALDVALYAPHKPIQQDRRRAGRGSQAVHTAARCDEDWRVQNLKILLCIGRF